MAGPFNIDNPGVGIVSGMDGVGNIYASGTMSSAAMQCGTLVGPTTLSGANTISTATMSLATIAAGTLTAASVGGLTTTGIILQDSGINSSGSINSLTGNAITANGTAIFGQAAASGTALADATRDYMLYFTTTTGGANNTLLIGSVATQCISTVYACATTGTGIMMSFRLPAGWYVRYAGTATIGVQNAVSC